MDSDSCIDDDRDPYFFGEDNELVVYVLDRVSFMGVCMYFYAYLKLAFRRIVTCVITLSFKGHLPKTSDYPNPEDSLPLTSLPEKLEL